MWKTASTTGIAVLRSIVTLSFPAPAQNGAVDSPRPRYEFAKSSACGKILCRRLRFLARRSGKTSCLHSLVRGSATRGCDECHKVLRRSTTPRLVPWALAITLGEVERSKFGWEAWT